MPPAASSTVLLRRAIALAKRLEVIAGPFARNSWPRFVAFTTLIRQRRLAEAVLRLGIKNAYESKVLLRSMIEIHFNSEWILYRGGTRRAKRFVDFHPLEQLRILDQVGPTLRMPDDMAIRRRLVAARAKVRHLFRRRNKQGKYQWSNTWATVTSLEARMRAVLARRKVTGPADAQFFYGLYTWYSSAVHGGPISMRSVIQYRGRQPSPRPQPEPDPLASIGAALLVLESTIGAVGSCSGQLHLLEPQFGALSRAVRELTRARPPLWSNVAPN
jgi:hypothetical protein